MTTAHRSISHHASPALRRRRALFASGTALAVVVLTTIGASSASAATIPDGPVDVGSAATFGVLAGPSITNTGTTRIAGDIGVSPGTSITGFDGGAGGSFSGSRYIDDENQQTAGEAQAALTRAIDDASSLTPQGPSQDDLGGLNLSPGVYSGGALLLPVGETLTLTGSAESVWVFQAASTLTVQNGSRIVLADGASACNVFWQIGTSATLNDGVAFQGTILASEAITLGAGTDVTGRLLAKGAVTLIQDTVTVPTGCAEGGAPVDTVSPTITSGTPSDGTTGEDYSFLVTATGTPSPAFTITAGELPAGLVLDETSGEITGTPTTPGTSTFTVTADTGYDTPDSEDYVIVVAPPGGSENPGGGTPGGGNPGGETPGGGTPGTPAGTPPGGGTPGTPGNPGTPVGTLAATGVETPTAGVAAVLLMLAGGAVLLLGRRRRALV